MREKKKKREHGKEALEDRHHSVIRNSSLLLSSTAPANFIAKACAWIPTQVVGAGVCMRERETKRSKGGERLT